MSYTLNKSHYSYANTDRIVISKIRQITRGDTSNNSILKLPSHFGTHIDFPYHFNENGVSGDLYKPSCFIFDEVFLIELKEINILDYQITENDFIEYDLPKNADLLLIKTGMGKYIERDEYWNSNPAISPDLAVFLKEKMPSLRAIGFDSISLTGWKYKDIGKKAHKSFLIENNILVIEDMDLHAVNSSSEIQQVIASPLRFENADGSPATVFAYIK